jgi:hypothetical protein
MWGLKDECNGSNLNPGITDDRIDQDGDGVKDCIDPYLNCDSDASCEENIGPGVVDEDCSCPDCNLTSPPAGMCPAPDVCINWTCGNYDDSAFRCEYSDPDSIEGNCTANEDTDCWDDFKPLCCGDDGGATDTWINENDANRTGCSGGEYCAWHIITDGGGTHLGCCPRPTDIVEIDGDCIPTSAYIKPTLTSNTSAEGSTEGSLSSGTLYAYNQTVTVSIGTQKVFEVEGYFSSLDKKMIYGDVDGNGAVESAADQAAANAIMNTAVMGSLEFIAADTDGDSDIDSTDTLAIAAGSPMPVEIIPAGRFVPEGYVDMAALHIETDGVSTVYANVTGIASEISRNRISNEYTVFLPNTNDGDGMIICLDPEQDAGEYGGVCSVDVEFRSAGSKLGFTLSATAEYYEITTTFDQHDDWYAFTSITPDLKIYDDADIRTDVVSFEDVGFYVELENNGNFVEDALCRLTWLDTNQTITMQNRSSQGYYYTNRTYDAKGTYEWEVSCSHPVYQPVAGIDTVVIKPNSELVISDITDIDSETIFIGDFVEFRAIYREAKGNQSVILGAQCNITYHDGTWEIMDYDTEGFYESKRNYSNYGSFSYTVRCSKTGFDLLADVDTADVFPRSCSRSAMAEEELVPGKAQYTVISKRGFVLLEKITE